MTGRRLILHVGSPKCGSTYLQRVLLQNRDMLLMRGINYPHDGDRHPGNASDIEDMTPARLEALFDMGVHTAVLSHEDLYSTTKCGDPLSELAPRHGVTVQLLFFMRPFSEFIFGDYSQYMKQHFEPWIVSGNPYDGKSFEEFTLRRWNNLRPAIFMRQWQRRFPATKLMLESHRNIRPVLERLLRLEPGAPVDWEVPRRLTNPSLRIEDCDRLAAALRAPDRDPEALRAMYRAAIASIGQPDAGRSPERIAWIEEKFAQKNRVLLEEFNFDNRLKMTD